MPFSTQDVEAVAPVVIMTFPRFAPAATDGVAPPHVLVVTQTGANVPCTVTVPGLLASG